jgi:hypothetical protein
MRRATSNTAINMQTSSLIHSYAPMQALIGLRQEQPSNDPKRKITSERDGFLRRKVKQSKESSLNAQISEFGKLPIPSIPRLNFGPEFHLDDSPMKPISAFLERKSQKYLIKIGPDTPVKNQNHSHSESLLSESGKQPNIQISQECQTPNKQIRVLGARELLSKNLLNDTQSQTKFSTSTGKATFKIGSKSPAIKFDTGSRSRISASFKVLKDKPVFIQNRSINSNQSKSLDLKEFERSTPKKDWMDQVSPAVSQGKGSPINLLKSRDYRSPPPSPSQSVGLKTLAQNLTSKLSRSTSLAEKVGVSLPRFAESLDSRDSESSSGMRASTQHTPVSADGCSIPAIQQQPALYVPSVVSMAAEPAQKPNLKNFLVDPKSAGIEMSVTDFRRLDLQHHGGKSKQLKGCLKQFSSSAMPSQATSRGNDGNQDSPSTKSSKGAVSFSENVVLILYQA